jgi:hypothetical protein
MRFSLRRALVHHAHDALHVGAGIALVGDEAAGAVGEALGARTSFTRSPSASFTAFTAASARRWARPSLSGSAPRSTSPCATLLQRRLSNSVTSLHDPLVDGVVRKQHVVPALPEGLEVRARLDGAPADARHVVDVLLPLGHRLDVLFQGGQLAGLGVFIDSNRHSSSDLRPCSSSRRDALLEDLAELRQKRAYFSGSFSASPSAP